MLSRLRKNILVEFLLVALVAMEGWGLFMDSYSLTSWISDNWEWIGEWVIYLSNHPLADLVTALVTLGLLWYFLDKGVRSDERSQEKERLLHAELMKEFGTSLQATFDERVGKYEAEILSALDIIHQSEARELHMNDTASLVQMKLVLEDHASKGNLFHPHPDQSGALDRISGDLYHYLLRDEFSQFADPEESKFDSLEPPHIDLLEKPSDRRKYQQVYYQLNSILDELHMRQKQCDNKIAVSRKVLKSTTDQIS
jgi:hypothetical protein